MAIVQMKKVSLVILDSTRKASLKQLRKAGVLHLEAVEALVRHFLLTGNLLRKLTRPFLFLMK